MHNNSGTLLGIKMKKVVIGIVIFTQLFFLCSSASLSDPEGRSHRTSHKGSSSALSSLSSAVTANKEGSTGIGSPGSATGNLAAGIIPELFRNETAVKLLLDRHPWIREMLRRNIRNSMVDMLTSVTVESNYASEKVIQAGQELIQDLVKNAVNLTSIAGYLPQLFLLDVPTQFTRMLEIVQKASADDTAFKTNTDILIDFMKSTRENGIQDKLFGPIVSFLPNLFNGVGVFLLALLEEGFTYSG